jgi:hypothetical protein
VLHAVHRSGGDVARRVMRYKVKGGLMPSLKRCH